MLDLAALLYEIAKTCYIKVVLVYMRQGRAKGYNFSRNDTFENGTLEFLSKL